MPFTGKDVVDACVAITEATATWNGEHQEEYARPVQTVIQGRAGVYVWMFCIDRWALKHRRPVLPPGSRDLWDSLDKRHELMRNPLPPDFEIDVLVLGWNPLGKPKVEQGAWKQFLEKVSKNHKRPKETGIKCRVVLPSQQDPIVPASKVTIPRPTSKNVYVRTASPAVLLAQNFRRLASARPPDDASFDESRIDAWREVEILYVLQQTVASHLGQNENNQLLLPFLLNDLSTSREFKLCIDNQGYTSIKNWQEAWLKKNFRKNADAETLHVKILLYFRYYFKAEQLDTTARALDNFDILYFPFFPPTPHTVQAQIYSRPSPVVSQPPPSRSGVSRVFRWKGGGSS